MRIIESYRNKKKGQIIIIVINLVEPPVHQKSVSLTRKDQGSEYSGYLGY